MVNIPGEQPYAVRIGSGLLAGSGSQIKRACSIEGEGRALVITDSNVAPLYRDTVRESLAQAGMRASDIVIPAGEESKSLEVLGEVWEAMAQLGLERDCVVVALGGGVVGDLAGFAAASYMRGVTVVQVPTTLLAMVDSSVGGKTAVNLEGGKNLVGAFKQPAFVCADTATLSTLPEREWRCGLAEVAKSSVIDSDDFFFWMCDHASARTQRDDAAAAEAIARCVVFKANVVAQDKTESKGVRECLNLGHTLGHAIEKLAGYGTFTHGEAVAEGMRFAAAMAQDLAGASSDFVQAQNDLLDELGLAELAWAAKPEDLLEAMKRDKKARGGRVRFVLPRDVGAWELVEVDDQAILEHLQTWAAGKRAQVQAAE